jgi:hypothetical protein
MGFLENAFGKQIKFDGVKVRTMRHELHGSGPHWAITKQQILDNVGGRTRRPYDWVFRNSLNI